MLPHKPITCSEYTGSGRTSVNIQHFLNGQYREISFSVRCCKTQRCNYTHKKSWNIRILLRWFKGRRSINTEVWGKEKKKRTKLALKRSDPFPFFFSPKILLDNVPELFTLRFSTQRILWGNNAGCRRPSAGSRSSSALSPGTLHSSRTTGKLICPQATFTVSSYMAWCDEMPNNPLIGSEHPDTGMSTPRQLTSSPVTRLSHPHERRVQWGKRWKEVRTCTFHGSWAEHVTQIWKYCSVLLLQTEMLPVTLKTTHPWQRKHTGSTQNIAMRKYTHNLPMWMPP